MVLLPPKEESDYKIYSTHIAKSLKLEKPPPPKVPLSEDKSVGLVDDKLLLLNFYHVMCVIHVLNFLLNFLYKSS